MFTKRIIPCLDVNNGRVVKGVNFVQLRDAGDPVEIAKAYDAAGADELVFLDITASCEQRDTVVDMVRRVAANVFIPFTVGGGIRTVDDFKKLLREGADKISVNSAAIDRPELISEAADKFGSQCVVVAIDAKLFSEIVRKLPDNDITLSTDSNNNALITCEKSKFNIAGKSGDDFSYLPAIIKDKMITLSQFQLKEVINQTIFSIAINDNNKMMTGELFEISEGTLKVVGLDGHRIAIRNIKLEGRADDVRVVIPGKTLQEISKILNADAESLVNIYFTNNHVLFEFDQTHVVSRLIEGDYFKINQMLSNDYETKVSINKKEFLDSIDRANLLIREGDKKPIIINIQNGLLQVNVNSAIGALNEDIDIDKEGKDIMIGFNPKFLMDALRVIDDENVTMYLVNHKSPCFIRDKEENYIYLILPVNFTA